MNSTCLWTPDEGWEYGCWSTACGEEFYLEVDAPEDNGMRFCCYCGKPLVQPKVEQKSELAGNPISAAIDDRNGKLIVNAHNAAIAAAVEAERKACEEIAWELSENPTAVRIARAIAARGKAKKPN